MNHSKKEDSRHGVPVCCVVSVRAAAAAIILARRIYRMVNLLRSLLLPVVRSGEQPSERASERGGQLLEGRTASNAKLCLLFPFVAQFRPFTEHEQTFSAPYRADRDACCRASQFLNVLKIN